MPWQNRQTEPADTSIRAAFKASIALAARWHGFINRQCGVPETEFLKPFDDASIRANAALFTPFVWLTRKFQR